MSNSDEQVEDVVWFNGMDCIGIVLVDTPYGHKAYIGVGRENNTEQQDIDFIRTYGTNFYLAHLLWNDIKDWAN